MNKNLAQIQASPRRAFTLIEVLITTVLTSVLLWGMWGVIGTYLDLFNKGERIAELSQLVRGLTQQLEADLKGVVPVFNKQQSEENSNSSSATNTFSQNDESASTLDTSDSVNSFQAGQSSSVVQFGLVGSSRTLRLDLIQMVPEKKVDEDSLDTEESEEKSFQPKVSELRTVIYTFEKGHEWSPADNEPPPGFIRREMSWEEYLVMQSYSNQSSGDSSTESTEKVLEQETEYDEDWPGNDEKVIWAPEIYNLKFRYFNGNIWLGEWNSYSSNSLPAAVEVVFAMESVNDRKLREKNYEIEEGDEELLEDEDSELPEPVELDTLAGEEVEVETLEAGSRPLFRQVIYLPMGTAKKEKSTSKNSLLKSETTDEEGQP